MPSPLLLAVFFLSGFCALTYEVAWTRMLDHVFGVSVFATTTVLSTFMAGLALGAMLAGRRADAAKNPVVRYAALELGIAACAFVTPTLFGALEPLYGWFYRGLSGHPVPLTAARAALAFAALIVPASLMGATFPFMTRSLVRRGVTAGRDLGLLYGTNTVGGVAGCLGAGFLLLPHLGTSRTIYVAGILNVIVASIAFAIARRRAAVAAVGDATVVASPAATTAALPAIATAVLVLAVFVSGFASLGYEVVWFRGMLSYLYNSTYAFSLMLATFLLGIGVGGLAYGMLPASRRSRLGTIGLLTFLTGVGFWISTLLFPDLNAYAYALLNLKLITAWRVGLALIALECALVLLVPAILLGMTFPASLDVLTQGVRGYAKGIGRLYSLNTLGGIAGSIVAGFVLIPLLGMRDALFVLIGLQLLLGLALVGLAARSAAGVVPLVVMVALVLLLPRPAKRMFLDAMNQFAQANRAIFYHEGITDTTAVIENIKTGARIVVYSDGRGTAGTDAAGTQKFLGHVPMMLHPDPKRVLNIGFGVGNSMSAIISHDPDRLDCVELSSQVPLTAPFFWTNEGVLEDPRVHLIVEDGATYVRYTDQRYDVISLEPPELHVAGVVNLYTKEFYENARRILLPGGLVEHWFTASQIPEFELKMLLRTFMTVFPYTVVFTELESTTYLMVGSTSPIGIDLARIESTMRRPKVARAMQSIGIDGPAALLSFFVAGQDQFWGYVGHEGPLVTDDRTYVDFMIPRSGEAGFGFGPYKHPKSAEPFWRRVKQDWDVIDRLRAAAPISRWIVPADGAAQQIEETVATQRIVRQKRRFPAGVVPPVT